MEYSFKQVSIPKHQEYDNFTARLATYSAWSIDFIDPVDLAKAGLFFTGFRDEVTCYFCGNHLHSWERGEVPENEHARFFPNCKLTHNMESEDLINEEDDDAYDPDPFYRQFFSESARLETYRDWKSVISQEELAKNGFIYQHTGDRVQCVFCRKCFSDWKPEDRIPNVHYRFSPECPFAAGFETRNVPLVCISEQQNIDKILLEFGFRIEDISNAKLVFRRTYGSEKSYEINDICNILLETNVKHEPSENHEQDTNLDERRQCKICFDGLVDMVLLPCGHLFCCRVCANILSNCSMCRKKITGRVQALL